VNVKSSTPGQKEGNFFENITNINYDGTMDGKHYLNEDELGTQLVQEILSKLF